jgi:hypothetical protein
MKSKASGHLSRLMDAHVFLAINYKEIWSTLYVYLELLAEIICIHSIRKQEEVNLVWSTPFFHNNSLNTKHLYQINIRYAK